MNQQTKIIIFIAGLFILSSIFLFSINNYYLNSEAQKNWWAVYFVNPKDNNFNFTIENHSAKTNFHWEMSDGENKLNSTDINIAKGSLWTSDVQNLKTDKKITITVSDGENKKEIYKNFK